MINHMIASLIASLPVFALTALGQPCTPALVGVQTGPQHVNLGDIPANIYDMEVYDDGSGPSLLVGGVFMLPPQEPNTLLNRTKLARYHNGQWSRMDLGLPIATTSFMVTDITQIDFGQGALDLIVAGTLGNVYRWDSAANSWYGANAGLTLGSNVPVTLLAYRDAQGPVLLAASNYPQGVMAWRGVGNWQPYAPLNITSGSIQRLRVIDEGDGPMLFAVGSFRDSTRNINLAAKLVNGQWQQYPLPSATPTSISDITRWDDGTQGPETYVTGAFCVANGCNVARFRNGTWQAVLGGITNTSTTTGPTFFQLDEGNGPQLYIGGNISVPNQLECVARITPSGWQAPVFLSHFSSSPLAGVRTMLRFNDGQGERTYIGGLFSEFRHFSHHQFLPAPTYGLVRGSFGSYESLARGLGEPINGITTTIRYDLVPLTYQGEARLFVGGPFSRVAGRAISGAALFDADQDVTPLSLIPLTTPQAVQGATVFPINGIDRIVASIPNSSLGPVAYWTGTEWLRIPGTFNPSPAVRVLTYNSELYAVTGNGLFRYNSGNWQSTAAVGSATNAIVGDLGGGLRIYYSASNGPTGPGVYEFNGVTAARVGATTIGIPQTLIIHDDGTGPALYVAGSVPGGVAKQTGGVWSQLGTGLIGTSTASALASFDDGAGPALFVAGTFTMAGGATTPGLAKWQNNTWITYPNSNIPPTTTNGRHSMAVFNDRLYIAGEFLNIGDAPADHLAYIQACPHTCSADYNADGDFGTDADIEAFFRCLAGNCCTRCAPDFNNDGNNATDADIESFFRVLAGGAC